ncbi:MAG: Hsp70 family protein [Kofleriaceae bacterium]|nr:Hsp70 family protein [Kofleriaceae bacterium]
MSPRAIGIDFGSTNSAAAVLDHDGRPRILTTPEGTTTMPSMVGLIPEHGRVRAVVGEAARDLAAREPELVITGIKRLLGRRADDPEIQRWALGLPFEVVAAANGDAWVRVRHIEVAPPVVAAVILAELRANARRFLDDEVDEAVITVPARFDARQRQAVKDAAAIAGLRVRRLVSEPTAAALGHGAHRGVDRRYAVCDLGGGTFDVSLCDVADGIFEVLATAGDPLLGGDDVDRVVAEQFVAQLRGTGVDVARHPPARRRLTAEAQRIKHALSEHASADARVDGVMAGLDLRRTVRRDELELWSAPVIRRLEAPCHAALTRAGLGAADLDEVLLVGGMTRMPAVRRKLAQALGREPTVIPNPDEVVAVGAAIEMARLEGRIDGVLLLDVTAQDLAIAAAGGGADVIVAAGSVVPTREHRLLTTQHDGQRELVFTLLEGAAAAPGQDQLLARYQLSELPTAPAGDVLVLVEVTVDVDGTSRVTASELVSGERPPIRIIGHAGLAPVALAELARTIAEWRAP